jgi:hypothetical protein
MKFYLDENMSPKVAEIMRNLGTDAISAHEVDMAGASDEEQLDLAARQGRCLVTFNRNDFIELSRLYLDSGRAHSGVIIVPYTFRGDDFKQTAKALVAFASRNAKGLPPYTVAFLSPA